jgi:biotin carboxyl carrier protein
MANDIKSKVKSLYAIMNEEKIGELEISSKDYSISIKRKSNNSPLMSQVKYVVEPEVSVVKEEQKQDKVLAETIKSPITGVFYASPSPSSPIFVNEGDIIEVGDTICIIEAMKVMNEVKATFKAKILKVLIENATSVNLAQDLFEVKKI